MYYDILCSFYLKPFALQKVLSFVGKKVLHLFSQELMSLKLARSSLIQVDQLLKLDVVLQMVQVFQPISIQKDYIN